MKQILLFFLLSPCLALAQYPANANQKITLGEQTTADGLIYRGVATDTTLTAKSDTAAYFVLDTVNLNLYTYKVSATGKKWIQLGSDTTSLNLVSRFAAKLNIADTASMLIPYIERGDTATMLTNYFKKPSGTTNYIPKFTSASTIGNSLIYDNGTNVGIGTTSPAYKLDVNGTGRFSNGTGDAIIIGNLTGNYIKLGGIASSNTYLYSFESNFNIGNTYSEGSLNLYAGNANRVTIASTGAATFSSSVTATTGTFTSLTGGTFSSNLNVTSGGQLTTNTSDVKYKYNIKAIDYGLETIKLLKPVNFQWINGEDKDIGFIAQDVAEVIPEAVSTSWNSDLLIRSETIIAILTKAMQEQQAQIDQLKQRIINLENK